MDTDVVVEDGVVKYIDALRFGNLERFKEIEEEAGDWWFPTLDRGAGAALHFAAESGQLECVRFLVEERGAPVNQRDLNRGWTPLHRCAQMAHHTHAPYLEVFKYLLQQGADASILSKDFPQSKPQSAIDGRGWEPGQVKAKLQDLVEAHSDIPKAAAFTHSGGQIGDTAARVLRAWERQKPMLPPADWRAPPPAGFVDAQGMRRIADEPWRPAGDDDGSFFTRPMTELELQAHSRAVTAAH
ncbi:probable protein phosphatase 1 regulatory subunit 27 at N-terminal half [Coccomyxa sp. Obi]|nr:probable protein phosphatase 1 regulatory subunit 27 at N-terminal half [Coccomyxa sp. Obi]